MEVFIAGALKYGDGIVGLLLLECNHFGGSMFVVTYVYRGSDSYHLSPVSRNGSEVMKVAVRK